MANNRTEAHFAQGEWLKTLWNVGYMVAGALARIREIPLPTVLRECAESEAAYWVATNHPEMYGRVRFELLP